MMQWFYFFSLWSLQKQLSEKLKHFMTIWTVIILTLKWHHLDSYVVNFVRRPLILRCVHEAIYLLCSLMRFVFLICWYTTLFIHCMWKISKPSYSMNLTETKVCPQSAVLFWYLFLFFVFLLFFLLFFFLHPFGFLHMLSVPFLIHSIANICGAIELSFSG